MTTACHQLVKALRFMNNGAPTSAGTPTASATKSRHSLLPECIAATLVENSSTRPPAALRNYLITLPTCATYATTTGCSAPTSTRRLELPRHPSAPQRQPLDMSRSSPARQSPPVDLEMESAAAHSTLGACMRGGPDHSRRRSRRTVNQRRRSQDARAPETKPLRTRHLKALRPSSDRPPAPGSTKPPPAAIQSHQVPRTLCTVGGSITLRNGLGVACRA